MLIDSLLPILVFFLIGLILRMSGMLPRAAADVLLRLVFHVTLPALAFLAIVDAPLSPSSALFPVAGFAVNLVCFSVAFWVARKADLENQDAGLLMLSASVANMVFMFPFILAILGREALANAVLIDFGNAVFLASVANSVAVRLGHQQSRSAFDAAWGLLRTPLFIALVTAVVLNVCDVVLPEVIRAVFEPLGSSTIVLTLVALGIAINVRYLYGLVPWLSVACRMAVGLLVGLLIVSVFDYRGTGALVIIASAAAPIGFSAVALASAAKLDTEKAAAVVSLSVLIGVVLTSMILVFGKLWIE